MAKICYVNGQFVHQRDAMVHMEDRGYQFSDGIYEVMAFYNRIFMDEALHMKRLVRSLKELAIPMPMSLRALALVMRELLARNDREHGILYLQINRGVAKRDHLFPRVVTPSIVLSLTGPKWPTEAQTRQGMKAITLPDIRWKRRDIKSVSLLPNVLARQKAAEAGVREAWLVQDGYVTEGSATNAYIVNAKGEVATYPLGHDILGGVTRDVVVSLARKNGIKMVERPFTVKEALAAKEAFITSTSANVLPIVAIDGKKIGDGTPGKVTRALLNLYYAHIRRETGFAWPH